MAEGAMPPSFPLAIPVINDNNGKIYTFMTNLSPLQTYINRLCQIRRLRLRFFLQSQLFHATQELMIRNEHSACLNHTTYNNKTINSLVFARSISRSWQQSLIDFAKISRISKRKIFQQFLPSKETLSKLRPHTNYVILAKRRGYQYQQIFVV